jgi:hypothetical protein
MGNHTSSSSILRTVPQVHTHTSILGRTYISLLDVFQDNRWPYVDTSLEIVYKGLESISDGEDKPFISRVSLISEGPGALSAAYHPTRPRN